MAVGLTVLPSVFHRMIGCFWAQLWSRPFLRPSQERLLRCTARVLGVGLTCRRRFCTANRQFPPSTLNSPKLKSVAADESYDIPWVIIVWDDPPELCAGR